MIRTGRDNLFCRLQPPLRQGDNLKAAQVGYSQGGSAGLWVRAVLQGYGSERICRAVGQSGSAGLWVRADW